MKPRPRIPEEEEIATLRSVVTEPVGVAMRSPEPSAGRLSLSRFRMLAIRDELAFPPSPAVARAPGAGASRVTRFADRPESGGHLTRGHGPHDRGVVTPATTAARVLRWRRAAPARMPRHLSRDERAGLRRSRDAVAATYENEAGRDPRGPVHL